MSGLTHFDSKGQAWMVDVGGKTQTDRTAVAHGFIQVSPAVFQAIAEGTAKKGDVLGVARVAGIMGAKKTSELIPLCHILQLTGCRLEFILHQEDCRIEACCTVRTCGKTGVEMEALTGVSTALLTIYDMCKAIDKDMMITGICLLQKEGGKSGRYERQSGKND
ncbi:MAG: cyclic pyranopterin monophosphate synthase MoaC [Lachnospiraceae bacterium]